MCVCVCISKTNFGKFTDYIEQLIQKFEKLNKKLDKQNFSIFFQCLKEFMQSEYTLLNIYIFIYIKREKEKRVNHLQPFKIFTAVYSYKSTFQNFSYL